MRISAANKSKLYQAIKEPIMNNRIAVAHSENELGKKNAKDIDDMLFRLEKIIWLEVTTVLHINDG